MHPNPIFRKTDAARSLALVRARGFGTVSMNGPTLPLLAHAPFLVSEDGGRLELHLMRSNPIWQALDTPLPAVVAVMGPDGYISPDWYGTPDQVPTWNYVAVHLLGTLHRLDHGELRDVLDRLSGHFEQQLAPKHPWSSTKMSPGVMDRMMRMIVPLRFEITDIHSTWKLGQNKPDAARLAAADQLHTGTGSELAALAALMQDPPTVTE